MAKMKSKAKSSSKKKVATKASKKTSKTASAKTSIKTPGKAIKKAKPAKKAASSKTPKTKVSGVKTSAKATTAYKLKVGDRVPEFSGASTSAKTINQDVHAKKALVLYFYPKDNTPGCTLESQDFCRLYRHFQNAGAEIVGVSQDSIASHEKFKSKCSFPFELLSDEDGSVCRAFDVMQMKSMYGRDFIGIERSTFLIDSGLIVKEWRKVKVTGHAQEVLEAVKAL